MNSLSYALLSLLVRKPCSGYELRMLLDVLWPAKHSQIYPLLTKLKEKEWVTFEQVQQKGRPDKKIYSITDSGKDVLKDWLQTEPEPPIQRDEFLIKAYAIWLTDERKGKKLIVERLERYKSLLSKHESVLKEMEEEFGGDLRKKTSPQFGRFILFKRRLRMDMEEIDWCEWVLELLQQE